MLQVVTIVVHGALVHAWCWMSHGLPIDRGNEVCNQFPDIMASVGNSVVFWSKVGSIHFTLRLKFTLLFMLPRLYFGTKATKCGIAKTNIPKQLNNSSRHLNLKWHSRMSSFLSLNIFHLSLKWIQFENKPFRELLCFAFLTITGSASRIL